MVTTQTRPAVKGQKAQIVKYLEGRKARGKEWATSGAVAKGFGYSSAQAHLNSHLNDLVGLGIVERQPAEGLGRSRFVFRIAAV